MRTERATVAIGGFGSGVMNAVDLERFIGDCHLPGLVSASVNALTEAAYLEFDPSSFSFDGFVATLARAGFTSGRVYRL